MRTTLLVCVVSLLFSAYSSPARSQDASALQTCVFACLANSSGANSPEYHACVEDICIAETELNDESAWQSYVLTPDTPPYLDGRGAYVVSANEELTINYICGRDGDSALIIYGDILYSLGLLDGQGRSMRMTVDEEHAYWFGISEYESGLFADVAQNADFLRAMQVGDRLNIDLPGFSTTASLAGAKTAFDEALRYCAQP